MNKTHRMVILFGIENFALKVSSSSKLSCDVGNETVVEDWSVVGGNHHRRTEIGTPGVCKKTETKNFLKCWQTLVYIEQCFPTFYE